MSRSSFDHLFLHSREPVRASLVSMVLRSESQLLKAPEPFHGYSGEEEENGGCCPVKLDFP